MNDIDKQGLAYNKGFIAGQEHQNSSPQTVKRFNNIENKMDEKFDKIEEAIKDLAVNIAQLPEKILEKADRRYGGKWVEKVILGVVIAVIAGIALVLLK